MVERVAIASTPPPIPGRRLDPPPKAAPDKVRELDGRSDAVGTGVGVGYRAFTRFTFARAPLLAAGTTYYLFLALFSVVAFAYGVTTALGADQVASYLTDAIGEAFPGLLGEGGIDPDELRAVGQTTSLVGLVGLLYGGSGGVTAARTSIHLVYGAPKDPRNVLLARLRSIGWLLLAGPLILVSFAASSVTAGVSDLVFDALGITGTGPRLAVDIGSVVLAVLVNGLIVYLLLATLGGIRPERRALVVAAVVGAVVFEVLKSLMGLLVAYTVERPQYGAFAAPIGVLFVLFLLSMALYACAALAAAIADRDAPLEHPGTEPPQPAAASTGRPSGPPPAPSPSGPLERP